MITKRTLAKLFLIAWTPAVVWLAEPVQACAVCYGNPDSDMVKGANAGILVMLFIAYGVLTSIAGVAGVWFVRARRASRALDEGESSLPASEDG